MITFERWDSAAFPCYRIMRDGVQVGFVECPTRKSGWCTVATDADGHHLETGNPDCIHWCGSFAAAKRDAHARWGTP